MKSKKKTPSKLKIMILEGAWEKPTQQPQILPFFNALAAAQGDYLVMYRTFRNNDDIKYYVNKLEKNGEYLLYFSCHAKDLKLQPAGKANKIELNELLDALKGAKKKHAIKYIHFGCCEMVSKNDCKKSLGEFMNASGAQWASGYTKDIDWIPSTLLDLAIIEEILCYAHFGEGKHKLKIVEFLKTYGSLVKSIGFRALTNLGAEKQTLVPG